MKKIALLSLLGVVLLAQGQSSYTTFKPGGDLSGTNTSQTIVAGAVTLAKQANLPAFTIVGNNTNASAAPLALTTLQTNVMALNVLHVRTSAVSNIALTGTPTIDGVATVAGDTVLAGGETSSVNNGLYVVAAGAWSRSQALASGQVIPVNGDIAVFVERGTLRQGMTYVIDASGGALTVGTNGLTFTQRIIPGAQLGVLGLVSVISGTRVPSLDTTPNEAGGNAGDCASFALASGSEADLGNKFGTLGPCMVSDQHGHIIYQNDTSTLPTVSLGSVAAGGTDNEGEIDGVPSTNTTLTLTFVTALPHAAVCTINSNAATPFPISVTANSTAAATFTFAALAGTTKFFYHCF
ncbi:MAG TPA: hypothetical protein VET48_04840 [Steroidobacteraceae bacterium]|nr:hypothetical protein [Steroidobacteraceae bacterium]